MHENTTNYALMHKNDANDIFASALVLNTVLFFIVLIFGTLSNALILYVYTFAMKKRQDRFFIPWLAVSDMLTCLFGSSFGIYLNFHRLDFHNDGFCRSAWILNSGSVYFGGCLLLVIAIQRHRKICHPFGLQLTKSWSKISIVIILILSALVAFPAGFFYGVSKLPASRLSSFDESEGFYFICETLPVEEMPKGFEVYNIIIGSMALIGITSVTILYTFIGMKMFAQLKFRKQNLKKKKKNKNCVPSESNYCSGNGDRKSSLESCDKIIVPGSAIIEKENIESIGVDIRESCDNLKNFNQTETQDFDLFNGNGLQTSTTQVFDQETHTPRNERVNNSEERNANGGARTGSDSSCESVDMISSTKSSVVDLLNVHPVGTNHQKKPLRTVYKTFKKTKSFLSTHRYSVIFILITVSFLISFSPRIYIMVIETVVTDFWFQLTLSEYRANLFLHQMYLLHSFCNPFIYAILDEKFKAAIHKKWLCCLARMRKKPVIVVN